MSRDSSVSEVDWLTGIKFDDGYVPVSTVKLTMNTALTPLAEAPLYNAA